MLGVVIPRFRGWCAVAKPAVPNASWPVQALIRRWSRSGWGDMNEARYRGVVRTLMALGDAVAEERNGRDSCRITTGQLAARSGYCAKWTQTSLNYLEQLGLITWTRGGIWNGKPRPSRIVIQRARLAAITREAMQIGDERDRVHCEAVREKIRKLGSPRWLQSRGFRHVEAAATPRPLRGAKERPSGLSKKERRTGRRAHWEPEGWEKYLPSECHPFGRDPAHCDHCRRIAIAELRSASKGIEDASALSSPIVLPDLFDMGVAL